MVLVLPCLLTWVSWPSAPTLAVLPGLNADPYFCCKGHLPAQSISALSQPLKMQRLPTAITQPQGACSRIFIALAISIPVCSSSDLYRGILEGLTWIRKGSGNDFCKMTLKSLPSLETLRKGWILSPQQGIKQNEVLGAGMAGWDYKDEWMTDSGLRGLQSCKGDKTSTWISIR